jgi:hypothetical protein
MREEFHMGDKVYNLKKEYCQKILELANKNREYQNEYGFDSIRNEIFMDVFNIKDFYCDFVNKEDGNLSIKELKEENAELKEENAELKANKQTARKQTESEYVHNIALSEIAKCWRINYKHYY